MNIFDHPNEFGAPCEICGTNDDFPVTLVPIAGTDHNGIINAHMYHLKCIELIEIHGPDGRVGLWQEVT